MTPNHAFTLYKREVPADQAVNAKLFGFSIWSLVVTLLPCVLQAIEVTLTCGWASWAPESLIPCSLALEGVVEEGCHLNKCLLHLEQLNCSLGVQYGHSQSSRQNKLRHPLAADLRFYSPGWDAPNETGRSEDRNAAVGTNQKKCSRCQPWHLRRAVTSLPSQNSLLPGRRMAFCQHLTLLQVFQDNRQVFLPFCPQDNQTLKQNRSSYFHSLLFVKTEVPKVSFQ